MGFIEAKQYTSAAEMRSAHAATRARLIGQPHQPKPKIREVIKLVYVHQEIQHDAHVNDRYRYLAKNPQAMKRAIWNLISDAVTEHNNQRFRALPLIRKMCYYYGVTYADIISANRTAAITFPRQKMMWVVKQATPLSLPEIGRRFGGRDHTTALHGIRKIDALIAANDPSVAELKQWGGGND
jgi:chromosomal replication initiation ATPase DnaA